jgi:FkbM family methyltransferase
LYCLGQKIDFDKRSWYATIDHLMEIFIDEIYFIDAKSEKRYDGDKLLILDIGANIGLATIYFNKLYPHSRILSIEPVPGTFLLLKKNIQSNIKGAKVTLLPHAIGKDGKVKLYYNYSGEGVSSVINKNHLHSIFVKSVSLHNLMRNENLDHVDILKMDIEGAEKTAFIGLKSSDFAKIKTIIMEWHYSREDFKAFAESYNLHKTYNISIEDLNGGHLLIRMKHKVNYQK